MSYMFDLNFLNSFTVNLTTLDLNILNIKYIKSRSSLIYVRSPKNIVIELSKYGSY